VGWVSRSSSAGSTGTVSAMIERRSRGQLADVGAAGAQHPVADGIFKQGQQQVLDGHEFMPLLACLLVALANGESRSLLNIRFASLDD
jgi:hypothetical protein